MIYRNGKKISAIFRNGKAIGKIFLNGKLVWQKDKPETKRVKSIKVALPEWGTPERIEWESILRAVPSDSNGYYLDVTIKGLGLRLRGTGSRHAGILTENIIEIPSSMFITTNELYSGVELAFEAKLPSITSEPTQKSSMSSYKGDALYQFEGAPFLEGSIFTAKVTRGWTVWGNLSGEHPLSRFAEADMGSASEALKMKFDRDGFLNMAKTGTATTMKCVPSFFINLDSWGKISNPTLVSPACYLFLRMKIINIETY